MSFETIQELIEQRYVTSKVTFCDNVFEPDSWETIDCANVADAIIERYIEFPPTARIYHRWVSEASDVTPFDAASADRLATLEGEFYVLIYPELPLWALLLVIAVAIAAVSILIIHFIKPSVSPNIKGEQQTSPNNSLSDRQNAPRINQRIPDIYGEVQSVPDEIQVPYRVFIDNQEIEVAYDCIGRGSYAYKSINQLVISLGHNAYNPDPAP